MVGVVVEDKRAPAEAQDVPAVGRHQVGLGEHLVGRPGGHEPPGQQEEVVGLGGVGQVVGGYDDGPAPTALVGDHVEDALPGDDVEPRDRLVEQEHLGVLGQALGHEHPLALPAREGVERPVDQLAEVEGGDGVVDEGPIGGPQAAPRAEAGVAPHGDRLAHGHGEVGRDLGALEDVGHPPGRGVGQLEAAGAGGQQAGQGVEEGGLPRAVGPDQGGDRAGGDDEGRRGQRTVVAVGELEVGGGGGGSDSPSVPVAPTVIRVRTIPVLVAGSLVLALTACGDDASGSGAAGEGSPATVVVTTDLLGDIVGELVGDAATVEVVMPPGSSPHEFAPSARQAAEMRSADVLVVNGLGFEAGLQDAIEAAEDDGVTVLALTDLVPDLLPVEDHGDEEHADEHDHAEEGHAEEDHGDEHDHGDVDPHVFTDPARMAAAVAALGDELAEQVPALDTPAVADRVAGYVAQLEALDASIAALVATVPEDRRLLVTNHEVLGYFADRYDFTVVGAVLPSTTTLAEPSAAGLADLADEIAQLGVPAIFAETSSPNRLAEALAAEGTDVQVVELFGEALGPKGSGAATYLEMQRTNAERIVTALGGATGT